MKWETVIGLEVHAELSTKSKIFCVCSTGFGAEPNTHVCPVCVGMPGTLPKLNRAVVDYALRLGLALGCNINKQCRFDRKNYFYPDLPKAYQLSQLYQPICTGGQVGKVRLHQIHMEEDAGKLLHDSRSGKTYMDYNRSGVPLLEIVSKPDLHSADEVIEYLSNLRETLLYLDICDCKMQEGSLRADVNLSVRPIGGELGTRTETKNLNSFKAISRAIEYEIERQIDVLEDGGTITQETRRWDDDLGESYSMRSKADAQDYRYFPDPDLLPISIDETWLEQIRISLPELAHQKRERYVSFGISDVDAGILTSHKNISDLFELLHKKTDNTRESSNLITGEIMRLIANPEDMQAIDTNKLSILISLVTDGKINRNAYKETVAEVLTNGVDPEAYVKEKGLLMIKDDAVVKTAVEAAIAANPKAVEEYKSGKDKAFQFLVGQSMRTLKGAGNPVAVKEVLENLLNSQ